MFKAMLHFGTLPDVLEVKDINLSNSYVTTKNFGEERGVHYLAITDSRGIVTNGTDTVRQGRVEVPLAAVFGKFKSADKRIQTYILKTQNHNVAEAKKEGTLDVIGENTAAEDVVRIAGEESALRDNVALEILTQFATIDVVYRKTDKVDEATGEVKKYFNISVDDITVHISKDLEDRLNANIHKVTLL